MAQIYKTLAGGVNVPFDENGLLVLNEDITAAITLTQEDSGKVYTFNVAAGVAVTLPAVAAGLNYRFYTGLAFITTAFTIVSTTAVIQGGAIVNSVNVPAVNETTITVAHASETVGDYIDLVSDGTNWYVSGVGFAAGAYTFA